MSNLWWLDPSWKDAACARCGTNIWDSGGDPDHGYCYNCFSGLIEQQQPEPRPYPCDICGEHPAVAGSNGYGVCSEACSHKAADMEPPER